jgi:hypothetical protein
MYTLNSSANAANIYVWAGEANFQEETGFKQEIQAAKLHVHENYNANDFTNDVGLIEVRAGHLSQIRIWNRCRMSDAICDLLHVQTDLA